MTSITSITLEAADVAAAEQFYRDAFDLGDRLSVRAASAPSTGFRGYTLSLIVAQPANVTLLLDGALAAGATSLKPASKSLWGFGGVVQAPDGAIWKVATSSKKNSGPATRAVDDSVLLLGAEDVATTRSFYAERGFEVGKSFGKRYVEFTAPDGAIKLALYRRRALAKDAGVAADGSGSHRLGITAEGAPFRDPDGFAWEPSRAAATAAA